VNESYIWGWRRFLFWQRIFEIYVAVIHGWCQQQQQPQWSISVRTVLCFIYFYAWYLCYVLPWKFISPSPLPPPPFQYLIPTGVCLSIHDQNWGVHLIHRCMIFGKQGLFINYPYLIYTVRECVKSYFKL
jgi:hypothetical protein